MADPPLDLFPEDERKRRAPRAPLAERMRPRSFEEFVGQESLLKAGSLLRTAVDRRDLPSVIFWGPPGSGKTTIARLIAQASGSHFVSFSAVTSGVKEVREVIERARLERKARGVATLLFVDEIHRFNKAQQDAFLPHVEDGTVVLMGATTENPSFEVNNALLSRMQVIVLPALGEEPIVEILRRAAADPERGLGGRYSISEDTFALMSRLSNGDARIALNILEGASRIAGGAVAGGAVAGGGVAGGGVAGGGVAGGGVAGGTGKAITDAEVREAAQRKMLPYDRAGEEHFNIISALHKSLRGSDPDAGLYWLARMLEAGEDPLYVARRLIRFASEDVGLADPEALRLAVAVKDAVHFLGMPEGNTALAQLVIYLALAPKSNSVYMAYGRAAQDALEKPPYPVPLHIRNAPTPLMKKLGYGRDYEYAHSFDDAIVGQRYLPDELQGARYWQGVERGQEAELVTRLKKLNEEKAKRRAEVDESGTPAPVKRKKPSE